MRTRCAEEGQHMCKNCVAVPCSWAADAHDSPVSCSVLQGVAGCCSVWQCVAVFCVRPTATDRANAAPNKKTNTNRLIHTQTSTNLNSTYHSSAGEARAGAAGGEGEPNTHIYTPVGASAVGDSEVGMASSGVGVASSAAGAAASGAAVSAAGAASAAGVASSAAGAAGSGAGAAASSVLPSSTAAVSGAASAMGGWLRLVDSLKV